MAGIAAYFGKDHSALSDLSDGLSPRGHDTAAWRDGQLGLATRAALPTIHRSGRYAAVVEGVTEISRLFSDYARHGAAALVRAGEPYAVALADPKRDALVLARAGDGPTLYYALVGELAEPVPAPRGQGTFQAWTVRPGWSVLAAAEPAALVAAGIPAAPDPRVVRRFVDTGACDDSAATFLSGVRRLLPGQVVEVTHQGVRVTTVDAGAVPPPRSLPLVVEDAVRHGRVGVRLADTPDDGVLLAAVLADPAACRPVPAYQAGLAGPAPTPQQPVSVRRVPVALSATRLVADLPAFLADVGEPVPGLAGYELWASARVCMGEVDTLLDPSTARPDGPLSRVADRVGARFGVSVRFPMVAPDQQGDGSPPDPSRIAEILEQIKDRVYGAFLTEEFAGRPWVKASTALGRFDAFLDGRGNHDPDWFWRLYLVEQWLRQVVAPARRETAPVSRKTFEAHPGRQLEVTVENRRWLRFPVRTDRFAAGDQVGRKIAGYVSELVAEARAEPAYRDVFHHPWYVVAAEKAVAVAQGRSFPLWQIRPGRWARCLAHLTSRRPYGVGPRSAWILELAVRDVGRWRMLLATLAGLVGRLCGRPDWYDRVAGPRVAAIDGPAARPGHPAGLAATLGAADPDGVAGEIVAALRSALPEDAVRHLAGCVVMDAREDSCRVRGRRADRTGEFFAAAFADNPLGQGGEQTPVAVMVTASAVRRPKRSKSRSKRRQPAKSR